MQSLVPRLPFQMYAIRFVWAVASDRSGTDHGSVNQMITGILPHLKSKSSALISRIETTLMLPKRLGQEDTRLILSYISRRGSMNRRLEESSERQLLANLREGCRDIAVNDVLFAGYTLAEQVDLARRSHLMLGVHGNGLSNALWMRSPGALLEMFPQGARIVAYQQFAEARGLWYAGFVGSNSTPHREGSCGHSAETYAQQCAWVLSLTGNINVVIRDVPQRAVVRSVKNFAQRIIEARTRNR
jgi:hypothetical protein